MKKKRNIVIGLMAVTVIMSGIMLLSKTTNAAYDKQEDATTKIVYIKDTENYNIKDYWDSDESKRTAPKMEGYIFAGWYSTSDEESALTAETAATAEEAYAKFVPDYVLSVRAQNEDGTSETDNKASSTRVLSSVDSFKYQNVGFDIWLSKDKTQLKNTDDTYPLKTNQVYRNILVNEKPVSATDTFGEASEYFIVWRLDNIANENDGKIIYVRPYWTTLDGTTVYGLAKYVHVEDQYKNYISVPINLMTGEAIAAGVVKMKYSTDLTFVDFEEGRVLTDMLDKSDTNGIVKMIGNAEKVYTNVSADGIYGNLRFQKPTSEDFDPNQLIFELLEDADFSNWDKEKISITPIIQY